MVKKNKESEEIKVKAITACNISKKIDGINVCYVFAKNEIREIPKEHKEFLLNTNLIIEIGGNK